MKTYSLRSQDALLTLEQSDAPGSADGSVRLSASGAAFQSKTPLALEIVDKSGTARWLYGGYSKIGAAANGFKAEGKLITPAGTQFHFQDQYKCDSDGFLMTRRIEIAFPHPTDVGFSTRFCLGWATPETTRDCDILMPGVWYRDNKTVPPRAFGADRDAQILMCREDRLGLPLAAARDTKSGCFLVLERVGGDPTTLLNDRGNGRITDERFQVGALGFLNTGNLTAAFTFPGTEDERSVIGSETPAPLRFAPRSHPVRRGVPHTYTLRFTAGRTRSFAAMAEDVTRGAITRAQPKLVRADLNRVYRSSMDLLNTVTQEYNGTVAVPFQVVVPSGAIKDTSSQMGFVGMGLPCAALLLKDGLERNDKSAIERATRVLDFWSRESPEPSGNVKNWSDYPSPGKITWRPYPTHLRVASDGMRGVLRAWNVARSHGIEKPNWLTYATTYGDFLLKRQNTDGSWFGSWNFDGTPKAEYKNASTHPIAFLIELSRTTGNPQYEKAALQAGEYCLRTVHQAYAYVGGTPDNPNVTDKEAGMIAVDAFLSLYDVSGDRKWRDAAQQAAIFSETWVYWRDLPIPKGNPKQVFPKGRAGINTIGLSLISTGHSGTDNFMALAPFLWYRLYLATGDAHFLQTARLLLHNTKQIIDWDGKLNYKYPGLMPEAMGLATGRGEGVGGWLPWLTFVVLDPLVRLQETFGSLDIDRIERLPLQKRRELNKAFGRKPER